MDLQVRAILAAGAVAGFGIVAIGVRELLQRRWTGRSGVKLRRYGTTAAERLTFVCLGVAAVATAVGVVLPVNGCALGGPESVPPALALVAFVIALAGIGLTFWAQVAMGASWRIGMDRSVRTDLVTRGPYRWVRNPIYTSMLTFLVGLSALLPNAATLVALVVAFVGIEVVVRAVEEPFLLAEHGMEYRAWWATAGRFMPRVRRRSRPARA